MEIFEDEPKNRIALILGDHIHIANVALDMATWLIELGAHQDRNSDKERWVLLAESQSKSDLGGMLMRLRDKDFVFQGAPHGWPPSEILRELHIEGYAHGAFQEVLHVGVGKWVIYSRELGID